MNYTVTIRINHVDCYTGRSVSYSITMALLREDLILLIAKQKARQGFLHYYFLSIARSLNDKND